MARFHALEMALTTAASVYAAEIRNAELRSQLQRAASSIALNLAEGSGRTGKDRLHFYRIAYGSCRECQAAVEIVAGAQLADADKVAQWRSDFDQLGAMLWSLVH